MVARRDDPDEEVQFADGRILKAGHGHALFHQEGAVVYLAVPLRNAGAGIAYLYGYRLEAEPAVALGAGTDQPRSTPARRCGPGPLHVLGAAT